YCITFSVGNRFIVGATPFRRILQLHLCIVYFFSGFEKLLGYNWHNGEAVWKALHLPYMKTAISQHVEKLGDYPLVFIVAGWAVIFIEMAYPVFMNLSKTRTFWLVAAVLLHLGIAVSLELYFFSAMMIMFNLSAFDSLHCLSGDLLTIRLRPLDPAHQSPRHRERACPPLRQPFFAQTHNDMSTEQSSVIDIMKNMTRRVLH